VTIRRGAENQSALERYEEHRDRLGIHPSVDMEAALLYTWAVEVGLGVLESFGHRTPLGAQLGRCSEPHGPRPSTATRPETSATTSTETTIHLNCCGNPTSNEDLLGCDRMRCDRTPTRHNHAGAGEIR